MSDKDSTPIIRGQQCRYAGRDEHDIFSEWRCPVCNARTSKSNPAVCLNACHLTDEQQGRFRKIMKEISKVEKD